MKNLYFLWQMVQQIIRKRQQIPEKCGKAEAPEAKTRFSCIAEAHESTRPGIESVTKRSHEDHIAGKGQNSVLHHNPVHKFIPMPQAMKIRMQRLQWTRNGKSLRQFQRGSWTQSKAKRRFSKRHRKTTTKSTLLH